MLQVINNWMPYWIKTWIDIIFFHPKLNIAIKKPTGGFAINWTQLWHTLLLSIPLFLLLWLFLWLLGYFIIEKYDRRPKVYFKLIPPITASYPADIMKRVHEALITEKRPTKSWWDYILLRITPPPSFAWEVTPLGYYLVVPKEYAEIVESVLASASRNNVKFSYRMYEVPPYDFTGAMALRIKKITLEEDKININARETDADIEAVSSRFLKEGQESPIDPASDMFVAAARTGGAIQVVYRPLWNISIWTSKRKKEALYEVRIRYKENVYLYLPPFIEHKIFNPLLYSVKKVWEDRAINRAMGSSLLEPKTEAVSLNSLTMLAYLPINLPPEMASDAIKLKYATPEFIIWHFTNQTVKNELDTAKYGLEALNKIIKKHSKHIDLIDNKKRFEEIIDEVSKLEKIKDPKELKNKSDEIKKLVKELVEIVDEKINPTLLTENAFTVPPGEPPEYTLKGDFYVGQALRHGNVVDTHILQYKSGGIVDAPHIHVIGVSGSGKTSLLISFAIEAIKKGVTLIVLEPHGGLTEGIYEYSPIEPLYATPGIRGLKLLPSIVGIDEEYAETTLTTLIETLLLGFRSHYGSKEKEVLVAWGGNTEIAIELAFKTAAFLPNPTIDNVLKIIEDRNYRMQILNEARQNPKYVPIVEEISTQWNPIDRTIQQGGERGNQLYASIYNKLRPFTRSREHAAFLSGDIDLSKILTSKEPQVLLTFLSTEFGTYTPLTASLIYAQILKGAMDRGEDWEAKGLPPVYVIIDEAKTMISGAGLLGRLFAESRKYGVGLVVAHQTFNQFGAEAQNFAAALENAAQTVIMNLPSQKEKRFLEGKVTDLDRIGALPRGDFVHVITGAGNTRIYRGHAFYYKEIYQKQRDFKLVKTKKVPKLSLKHYGAQVFFPYTWEKYKIDAEKEEIISRVRGYDKIYIPLDIKEDFLELLRSVPHPFPEAIPPAIIATKVFGEDELYPWYLNRWTLGFVTKKVRDKKDKKNIKYPPVHQFPVAIAKVGEKIHVLYSVPISEQNMDTVLKDIEELLSVMMSSTSEYRITPYNDKPISILNPFKKIVLYIFKSYHKNLPDDKLFDFSEKFEEIIDAKMKVITEMAGMAPDNIQIRVLPSEADLLRG